MPHHLNAVELAEHRILVVLFLDCARKPDQWIDRERMATEYHVSVDERLFASILAEMKSKGWADTWLSVEGGSEVTAGMLKVSKHAKALSRILDTLEAKTFEVDWQTKRIVTDASDRLASELVPSPDGWMLLTMEREEPVLPRERSAPGSRVPSSGNSSHSAGRDINIFHAAATQNNDAQAGDGWWTKWGVILTGIGLVVAVLALYFTDAFPWKWQSKPVAVETVAPEK